MGSIAEQFSDHLYITSDNPRSEEPQNIVNDILMGIKKREKITIEIDRFKAINESIKFANKKDPGLMKLVNPKAPTQNTLRNSYFDK